MRRPKPSEADVRDMLFKLAARFGIPTPGLYWRKRTKRGQAHYNRYLIEMGPRSWRSRTEACAVHEFAHLLTFKRDPYTRTAKRWIHHGKVFKCALLDTVIFWYGDYRTYPWHREHKRTRKGMI